MLNVTQPSVLRWRVYNCTSLETFWHTQVQNSLTKFQFLIGSLWLSFGFYSPENTGFGSIAPVHFLKNVMSIDDNKDDLYTESSFFIDFKWQY